MHILFYLFFIVFSIIFEILRKKNGKFDYFTLFTLNFNLYYLIPALLLNINFQSAIVESYKVSSIAHIKTEIAVLIGYFFVLIGYFFPNVFQYNKKIIRKQGIKKDLIFCWFLIGITLISICIYSLSYGGIIKSIQLSSKIRSGAIEATKFGFFKRFFPTAKYAFFILLAMKNEKLSVSNKRIINISFLLSIGTTLFSFLFLSSRGVLLDIIVIYVLFLLYKGYRIKIKNVVLILICSYIMLTFGDIAFSRLQYISDGFGQYISSIQEGLNAKSMSSATIEKVFDFFKNFQHPIVSLDVALQATSNNMLDYRFFKDFYYGVLSLVPSQLISLNVSETIAFYNTQLINGIFISNIPPGVLAFGVYSFSWFGLVAYCFIWGNIGKNINNYFNRNRNNNYWIITFYPLVGWIWSTGGSGEPRMFFQSNFVLILVVLFLTKYLSKTKKESNI